MANAKSKATVTGAGGVAAARGAGTAGTGAAKAADEVPAMMSVVQQGDRGLVVSAKAVHQALGVGRDFSNWLKSRISRYGFEAGADYWEIGDLDSPKRANQVEAHGGDRKSQDFWLSLDMAKELAMLERSDAGRAARKYFLDCERKLKEVLTQGQPRLEPELKMTQEEIDAYYQYQRWFDEKNEFTTMQINDELSFVVLPEILRQVLYEGGLNDEAIAKLDLRGYAPLLCTAMTNARCDVEPDDIAIRMRTQKMSPRLVETVRKDTQRITFGWNAGRQRAGAIRVLAAIGVR